MKRILAGLGAALGVVMVGLGTVVALLVGGGRVTSPLVFGWGLVLAMVAVAAALWKVRGRLDATSDRPVPWADESFATPTPEHGDDEYPLSSESFAEVIRDAASTARSDAVEAGIEEVRPPLRRALLDALEQGNWTREEAVSALESGEWTDDAVAASVLDPDVDPPRRSLRQRFAAWLYPERVLRQRTGRSTQAVAEAADEALSTVPGQTAPRTVPVLQPRLGELRRGADGELRRALDPDAVARGPEPPEPDAGEELAGPDEEVSGP